ncbi:MAG: tRNA (adenosine(37)-N6)-threonylcarbamoyltransferase complex ATPase subunit type 1 TsaE [Clostridia bacterium]|nr:tRNA (adenosine(37)-N6)-threonylcarbamoyltransferase complex ATPase subunit type 1 TsaE [Clostridia bacterium]
MQIEVISENEEMTKLIAKKYAQSIKSPVVISLVGDLGAGKTTFTKGFAEGLDIKDLVTSPTFTIMNDYNSGRLPLYHFDMYRLGSKEEAIELGFEEYFDLRKLNGVAVVEWAENVEGLLPTLFVEINIIKLEESKRKIQIGVKGWV